MELLASKAGTCELYVPVQGRIYPDHKLHIQGWGPVVNREYGVAVDLDMPTELEEWWEEQEHTIPSQAGTTAQYVGLQVRLEGDFIHGQVVGASLNRGYGVSMDIHRTPNAEPLFQFIERYVDEVEALAKTAKDITVL